MRLGKHYGPERLEAAAMRALSFGATSYRSVKSILEKGLDRAPVEASSGMPTIAGHANLRGAGYYGKGR